MSDSVVGRATMYADTPLTAPPDPLALTRTGEMQNALVFVRERWPLRLVRRLWALGIDRGAATRLVATVHPCAVQQAIEIETARVPASPAGRTDRVVNAALNRPPDDAMLARCRMEAALDRDGGTSFGSLLPANEIDANGRIGGAVIYVLDLGDHNEVLRKRFADRRWYRLGRHLTRGDARPTITPYE